MPQSPEAFYDTLKKRLQATDYWPTTYRYKFIVKTDSLKLKTLKSLFDCTEADIRVTPSRNVRYTSVSVSVLMGNPESVVSKYREVSEKVEGVISL